jgi:succinate dehydrogenase hydrophobic anchor subunit
VPDSLLELLCRARSGEGSRIPPATLRQAGEAAGALVLAGTLMLVVGLTTEWLNDHYIAWRHVSSSPVRAALLSLTCVAFAVQFIGLWKLGDGQDEYGSDRGLCIALRALAAAVLAYVLLIMPSLDDQHPLSLRVLGRWRGHLLPFLHVLGLTVPAMQAVLWLRVGRLARRLRNAWLHAVAPIVVCAWPGVIAVAFLAEATSYYWQAYVGSFEAVQFMPVTWLWVGRWFWPLRFGEYDQTCITLAWLLMTGLMLTGEIGLAVIARRRLREIQDAALNDQRSTSSSP